MKNAFLFFFLYLAIINHTEAQTIYTFSGNGNWSDTSNWDNNVIPPASLIAGAVIFIDPVTDGQCIVDVSIHIPAKVSLIVKQGKKLKIPSGLSINNDVVQVPVNANSIDTTGFANLNGGKNYYFSPWGSDNNTGLSTTSSFNISKLPTVMSSVVPGDSILFRAGETFYGSIFLTKSGTSTKKITIGSYGIGAKPVITGFTTATGFTNIGTNLWQSSAITSADHPNMVVINGVSANIGRYPNTGYLSFENSVGNTSITDNQLSGTPNWTGAEVVIRKIHWAVSRDRITGHSGATITYAGGSPYNSINGFGYFIQNDIRTVDTLNEWCYDSASRKLTVYSVGEPTNVKIPTINTLVNLDVRSYVTVCNLTLEGSNVAAINSASASTHNTVKYCTINFSGKDAIYGTNAKYLTIDNCNISNSNNNGIALYNVGGDSDDAIITNNTISKTGLLLGMSYNSSGANKGIFVQGYRSLIQYNTVDSTGYNGISFYYDNSKVKNNLVNNYCMVLDDGAGIYTWSGYPGCLCWSGREITDNIVMNGIGAAAGTLDNIPNACGIYLDDGSTGVTVTGNGVANVMAGGIYTHNDSNIVIKYNNVYGSGQEQLLIVHDNNNPKSPIRANTIRANKFMATSSAHYQIILRTVRNDIDSMAITSDSSYYGYITTPNFKVTKNGGAPVTYNSFAAWQTAFPLKDIHSTAVAITTAQRFEYNAGNVNKVITLPAGTWHDLVGNSYSGTITLAPWTTISLIGP